MSEVRATPARPEALDVVHSMLERFWREVGDDPSVVLSAAARFGFATAVAEVAANIILHAGSDTLELTLSREGTRIEARFHDSGVPFTAGGAAVPDPETLPEGGIGLLLARRALDRLEYSRSANGANCWRLVLVLEGPE